MLPFQHSKIQQLEQQSFRASSDLQSLQDFRQLLPLQQPVHAVHNYFINEEAPISRQGSSQSNEDAEEGKQLLCKVTEQCHEILKLREELYYYKTQFFRLAGQTIPQTVDDSSQTKEIEDKSPALIEQLTTRNQELSQKVETMRQVLISKEQELSKLRIALKEQASALRPAPQPDISNESRLLQQLRYQSRVIMDLTTKNEKILKINSYLKQQLSLAENKLVSIEMQHQEKTCGILLDNLHKLKQNHNMINHRNLYNLYQWRTTPDCGREGDKTTQKGSYLNKRETVKISTHRESEVKGYQLGRQSKTVEKDQQGLTTNSGPKLRPLQQPKPQRKAWCGEIDWQGKFQGRMSTTIG